MKLSALLDQIDGGRIALPEFQRGFVWGRTQVRGLMDSLYRGYPVGSLLVWETKGASTATRQTEHADDRDVDLLLDGQQRISSLYGVIRGIAPQFFQGDVKAFTDLRFNLETEAFEFYGPVKMRDDPLWVNVTNLFAASAGSWFRIVTDLDIDDETRDIYLDRLNAIRSISDVDFHVERITGDKNVDEVVDIFNRVNSGGTKLSKGDLALASLCGQWPEARSEIRRMIAKWETDGYQFEIEWLLRCATAIAADQAPFSALRNVTVDEFRVALEAAEESVDYLLNLLASRLGLDHNRVLRGRYGFTALSRYVSREGQQLSASDQGKLLYWHVNSLMWGRYSSSTETVLTTDLEALRQGGLDGLIAEIARWRGTLEVRPGDFDVSTVGARPYTVLYMLSRVGGAKDLVSGLELSASMLGKSSSLELHHIFPKKVAYDAGYERSEVNAVANFCFLTASSNRTISAGNPHEYLAEVMDSQPGVLESQWIPTDPELWKPERYLDFLAARRVLLADATNQLMQSLLDGADIGQAPGTELVTVQTTYVHDERIDRIIKIIADLGLAQPRLDHEIVDEDSGEVLAIADAVWPDGVQVGLSQPLAFLLEPDEAMESRLGELGYRFFTAEQPLMWYLEETTGIDIDGDGIAGEPS